MSGEYKYDIIDCQGATMSNTLEACLFKHVGCLSDVYVASVRASEYYVECGVCGATGPKATTEEKAIEAWSHYALSAEDRLLEWVHKNKHEYLKPDGIRSLIDADELIKAITANKTQSIPKERLLEWCHKEEFLHTESNQWFVSTERLKEAITSWEGEGE